MPPQDTNQPCIKPPNVPFFPNALPKKMLKIKGRIKQPAFNDSLPESLKICLNSLNMDTHDMTHPHINIREEVSKKQHSWQAGVLNSNQFIAVHRKSYEVSPGAITNLVQEDGVVAESYLVDLVGREVLGERENSQVVFRVNLQDLLLCGRPWLQRDMNIEEERERERERGGKR